SQVARTIRRPRPVRRRTELPLLFGLLPRRRLLCQRVRLQFPDSDRESARLNCSHDLSKYVGHVFRTILRPRSIRRLTELPLLFGLLPRRPPLPHRLPLSFHASGIVPVHHPFPTRRSSDLSQVARTIRRPRPVRRRTELPLLFGLLPRRRLLCQRVRLQFPD